MVRRLQALTVLKDLLKKESVLGFALSDIQLTTTAFEHGGSIPSKHTGEGEDTSPALSWSDAPEGTKAYAVICHDPDAPLVTPAGTYGFVHWVLYNIPGSTTGLAEAAESLQTARMILATRPTAAQCPRMDIVHTSIITGFWRSGNRSIWSRD